MYIEQNTERVSLTKYYRHLLPAEYNFRGHRHGTVEMNIILSGEMEITCGDNVLHAVQGEIIVIPSGVFHRNRVVGTEVAEMLEVRFHTETIFRENEISVYCLSSELKSLMELFCRNMEENALIVNGDCHRITENADMLLQVFLSYVVKGKKQVFPAAEESAVLYRTAVQFMLQNITEKLTVEQIARHCGVCRTTLKNVFSRYTGHGCIAHFEEMKLNRAKDYLLTGTTCAEIAAKLGFSSQAHFSKRFYAHFGVLPSKVRRKDSD